MNHLFTTHGAFSWSELMTDKPKEAVKFYTEVLGWKVEEKPMIHDEVEWTYYVMKSSNGEPVGGIMGKHCEETKELPNRWTTYVTVDDVDKTIETARNLGATILYSPTDIPEVGRMCAFKDEQGAVISVITYSKECHQ